MLGQFIKKRRGVVRQQVLFADGTAMQRIRYILVVDIIMCFNIKLGGARGAAIVFVDVDVVVFWSPVSKHIET